MPHRRPFLSLRNIKPSMQYLSTVNYFQQAYGVYRSIKGTTSSHKKFGYVVTTCGSFVTTVYTLCLLHMLALGISNEQKTTKGISIYFFLSN
jgi:hypothetical protein